MGEPVGKGCSLPGDGEAIRMERPNSRTIRNSAKYHAIVIRIISLAILHCRLLAVDIDAVNPNSADSADNADSADSADSDAVNPNSAAR